MALPLGWWTDLVRRNRALRLVDVHLRGAAEVMLQSSPLTGLLIISGIVWGASAQGNAVVALGAVVGLVVATITALLLNVDRTSFAKGMFGFNGILVGVAVPTFLAMGPATWFLLVIGAAVSTVVMLAIGHVMKVWGVPPLTFPFVLTSWFLVLAAYSFGHSPLHGIPPPAFPALAGGAVAGADLSALAFLEAVVNGISQVFLINDSVTGLIFIVALLVSSVRAAAFAVLGSVVSLAVALFIGADAADIDAGLYGFSPVLTAIALGTVFYRPGWRVAAFALLGTIFTVIVQGALNAAVAPLGIPAFTAAFVFVTWLFLLPKVNLRPHHHEPLKDGILTDD